MVEGVSRVPLDEVLARIGLGWFHVRLWWICGFGFSAAAIEVVLMSFVFPELQHAPWLLDEYQLGILATMIGCGSIFGTILFGCLADKYGRRIVFMTTVCIVVVFGIASSFSPSWYWLGGLRFCVGFGYGGNIAVDFTLYSEFLPTHGRGKMLFLLTGFWPVGQIFASLLAWYIIPRFGWQVFVAACTIPTIITAFARPFIPESPRWLLVQGQTEEATKVCRDIAELNGMCLEVELGVSESWEVCLENENTEFASDPHASGKHRGFFDSVAMFFCPALWRTTLGCLIMVSALNFTGYGTLTLMPRFLYMKGAPQENMYMSMVLNSIAELPGVALGTWAATHYGRLLPLRASMFLCGIGLLGFALVRAQLHITLCTMFASCFLEASWALYHVYVPEVYPTQCRGLATGFLAAAGSLVAIAGPIVSAALISSEGPGDIMNVIFVFASIAMFAGVSSTMLLHIETKDRDLADVSTGSKAALSEWHW